MDKEIELKSIFPELFEDFSHLGATVIVEAITDSDGVEKLARKLLEFHQRHKVEAAAGNYQIKSV